MINDWKAEKKSFAAILTVYSFESRQIYDFNNCLEG
jgi:hypothetical protein